MTLDKRGKHFLNWIGEPAECGPPRVVILLMGAMWCLLCLGVIIRLSCLVPYTKGVKDYVGILGRDLWKVLVAICFYVIVVRLGAERIIRESNKILIFSLLLLLLVLVPSLSVEINGARRWFRVGTFSFQPGEFVRLALALWLASRYGHNRRQDYVLGVTVSWLVVGLLVAEPSYTLGALVFLESILMLYISGVKLRVVLFHAYLCFMGLAPFLVLAPYRLHRIAAFLSVEPNKLASGYQVWQSLIAIASGGLLGKGIGESIQKLGYVPEARTDFISAIIAEELGLPGMIAVISAYFLILLCGFLIGLKCRRVDLRLAAWGCTLVVVLPAIIHLGVVTGLLPTTGIPLPFISFGGSAILVETVAVAVTVSIGLRVVRKS